ncbi:MAG: GNAT family N-acetyltransferase [Atopobium sp.]|uniref:GNAT family N-acetyltransferase n=1 Tax=Atopobium sp. TaxID=1872650 RepID=UPI002A751FF4|nr:GNAT family N-acetyltransferase [Atopobium sp.]MDY2787868.1 GNAT family N-acetyltransferase [Atopobium sp.]MDY4523110.1 GNAT family N-acetyltransferase [Atopobium sp.]
MNIYEVQDRDSRVYAALLDIWERSVRATHLFLSDAEVKNIKTYVPQALEAVKHLVIYEINPNEPVAFMGIENGRLEMLFIAPEARGSGIGKQLLHYGIQRHALCEVTVNEQNIQAVGFYKHMGFETYKRTDFDEEGNPYPLLYMKLT